MKRRRGFKDPFPRLPPGVTPSDIPGNRPQDVPPDERPDDREDPPDQKPCMVCRPPDKVAGRFKEVGSDLSRLPYCDDHDEDDLRAKLEHDEERREQERVGWTCDDCGLRGEGLPPDNCPACDSTDFVQK